MPNNEMSIQEYLDEMNRSLKRPQIGGFDVLEWRDDRGKKIRHDLDEPGQKPPFNGIIVHCAVDEICNDNGVKLKIVHTVDVNGKPRFVPMVAYQYGYSNGEITPYYTTALQQGLSIVDTAIETMKEMAKSRRIG